MEDSENSDIEIEEDETSINKKNDGLLLKYNGEETLNIPNRNSFTSEYELNDTLLFLPNDIEETRLFDNGYPVYALKLFGIIPNGCKTELIITNIKVFFDVLIENNVSKILSLLQNISNDDKSMYFKCEDIEAYSINGYSNEKKKWKRIYFNTLKDRKDALLLLREEGLTCASDDKSSYYRKVSREHGFCLSNWLSIKNYSINENGSPLCKYSFRVDVNNISNAELTGDIQDKTLVMTWDIETYSTKRDGNLPDPNFDSDNAFMICMSCHWKDEDSSLIQFCITNVECNTDERWITILCDNYKNIIKAFTLCYQAMAPDIIIGFNDSDYDWPFIITKAKRFGILCWMVDKMSATKRAHLKEDEIMQWNYKVDQKIKITAEEVAYCKYFKVAGCVPIDVRIVFKKLYPRAETSKSSSLKYYLEINDLGGKVDMPIIKLWNNYQQAMKTTTDETKENMHHAAYYCVIDAFRCQQLMTKRNVINDYREVSNIAYVSLFDSHYYAGGMRVCNLVSAYAWRKGILTSMVAKENAMEGKYPGAYVFPPDKGLTPNPMNIMKFTNDEEVSLSGDRPVTGLDFSSLYPSLIMTYNLSPEKIILDENEMLKWKDLGKNIHSIEFPYGNRQVKGWSVRDDIGLFPTILIDLFNKRAEIKKKLHTLTRLKELIELIQKKEVIDNDEYRKLIALPEKELSAIYKKTCFDWVSANTKQNAIKVYMNSFYGEAGNALSPFFMLELAGGVTSAGQRNIQLVASFVKSKGFRIKYGDTDSLYITVPCKHFEKCDNEYKKTKNKTLWYTTMVKITMEQMTILRNEVNKFLEEDNKTTYLKMAYEEVLFPVVFTGKKKYFGIPHINEVNFNPNKLFIKGIDIIKQGQAGLAKIIGERIMWKCMDINNTKSVIDIVQDVLRDAVINLSQWEFKHFVLTASYKPNKDNKRVQSFVRRMRNRGEKIPEAGERFSYVMVKNLYDDEIPFDNMFDITGKRLAIKKGDKMEYADIAKKKNLQIDINEYISSSVIGLCARFINQGSDDMSDEDIQKKSKKLLETFINDIENNHVDLRKYGTTYRRAYKKAIDYSYVKELHHIDTIQTCIDNAREYCDKNKSKFVINDVFKISTNKNKYLQSIKDSLMSEIKNKSDCINLIVRQYNDILIKNVNISRKNEINNSSQPLEEIKINKNDLQKVFDYKILLNKLTNVLKLEYKEDELIETIKRLKLKHNGIQQLDKKEVKSSINNFINNFII